MASLEKGTGKWRFGVFEVDAPNLELRRNGATVRVREQPFRILICLLEHAGELVSREDLRRVLWPSDTFVDFEHSLNTAMKKLREALGDSADEPMYIETIPKRGYRFIAALRSVEPSPVELEVPEQERPAANRSDSAMWEPGVEEEVSRAAEGHRSKQGLFLFLSVVSLVLILVWVGTRFHGSRREVSRGAPPHFHAVPITNLPGAVANPAISPDGKQVAFFWDPAGGELGDWAGLSQEQSGLYVQLIGGSQPLRLAEPKPGFIGHAAWSPDGRQIAFGRCNDDGGAIYTVSSLGGPEHKVTDLICLFGETGYANWTPDGKSLVLVGRCGPGQAGGIIVFSFETGQKRCLTTPPPGSVTDLSPVVSPDGQTVAFVRMSTSAIGDVYTVKFDGGEARRLTHENRGVWQLMWSADGQSIIFLPNQTGIDGLRRIPADGGTIELETLYPGVGSLAKDGSRLVYVQPQGFWASSASIWRADLASAGGKVEHTQRLASSNTFSGGAQISPDSNVVVFESARSGATEIWRCNADGSDPMQLTSYGGHAGTPRWAPDGKWIAFDYRPQEHSQIWLMDPDGRSAHAVVTGAYDNVVPSWTRDGKTILFASNRTGQYQVWAHDLATGRERQITAKGGFASFEAPDATSLLYTKFDGAGIWTVPKNGGAETLLIASLHLGYWGHFAVTESGIYFLDSHAAGGPTIEYYDFKTKLIRPILTYEKDQSAVPWTPNLGASKDGHTIYFNQGTTKSSIVMAEFTP